MDRAGKLDHDARKDDASRIVSADGHCAARGAGESARSTHER
jgi:hypothetical protein